MLEILFLFQQHAVTNDYDDGHQYRINISTHTLTIVQKDSEVGFLTTITDSEM